MSTHHDPSVQTALELRGVSYSYPPAWFRFKPNHSGPRGVHQISLRFDYATIYGLVGPNGAGKSTIFKLLSGMLKPHQGEIYLRDQSVTQLPRWQRARLGMGYLSQQGGLVNDLSVYLNLLMGLESGLKWGIPTGQSNSAEDVSFDTSSYSKEEVSSHKPSSQIVDALEHFGVHAHLTQRVSQLSGGERRKVELARILLQRPHVLILDEPFAALDADGIKQTMQLLKVAQGWGSMILLTDHQNTYIEEVCDCVLHLMEGKVVKDMSLLLHTDTVQQKGAFS